MIKNKEFILKLNKKEFCDLKTMIVLLHMASLSGENFTTQQKEILSSVNSIAKKIDELDPGNDI